MRIKTIGETATFSLGNIMAKYKNAAGIMLGPAKHIRPQNNLDVDSLNEKAMRTLSIHAAEVQENMENEIFRRRPGFLE